MIRKLLRKALGIPCPEIIPVKYLDSIYESNPLEYNGDWVDVRVSYPIKLFSPEKQEWVDVPLEDMDTDSPYVKIFPGELIRIPLGFALKLPKGYEAILKVRSSTSKNTGLVCATSGVIDEGYCGNSDEWIFTGYATRQEKLYIGERIAQFRIIKKQPELEFHSVVRLDNVGRGGHGSTGRF